jgi:fatty acid desaturase
MSDTVEKIGTILLAIAVIFIIAGGLWYLSTLGPIPGWGWLIIVGIAIIGFFYIMSRILGD